MRSRVLLSFVAAAAASGAPGCKRGEGPQVAFLVATPGAERADVRHFEARADALGMPVVTLAAGDDHVRQRAQVEDALGDGARVLVIEPTDSLLAASFVRLAHDRGAQVVAYDRAITSADLDYFVSHDSYRVGVLQAEAALVATAGRGRYVLLAGEAGHSTATEVTRGYADTLAPYVARGDVDIVRKQHHRGWSAAEARRTVDDALAHGEVDAILANSSGLARGAVQAVAAAGLGDVFIAGADADPANVNLVCQGKQTIEILRDVEPLAETAADVAKHLLAGAPPKSSASVPIAGADVPVAAVRVDVVTAETVKPLLIDSGVLSADELPACAEQLAAR